MRFLLHMAYNGCRYSGWQRQSNAYTVQEEVEAKLSQLLGCSIEIAGCGRTDTGVHAKNFYAHFDYTKELPEGLLYSINRLINDDIVFYCIQKTKDDFHARFDAISRQYNYYLHTKKRVFSPFSYYMPQLDLTDDFLKLQEAANILMEYDEFNAVSKTGGENKTTRVNIYHVNWAVDGDRMKFTITADRFLRGMVRLIVGMCIRYAKGQITKKEIHTAFQHKSPLPKALSVPAHALFLSEVRYDSIQ